MRPQPGMVFIIINKEPTKLRLPLVVPPEDEGGEGLSVPVGVGDAGAQALVPSGLAGDVPDTSESGPKHNALVGVWN